MKINEINVSYRGNNINAPIINDSKSAHASLLESWDNGKIEMQEEFKVLLLKRNNQVIGVYSLSKGGLHGTVIDFKLLFSVALKSLASNIILAHNHPSGNLSPSQNDISSTKKAVEIGNLLGIDVLDHIIITRGGYFSLAENGYI